MMFDITRCVLSTNCKGFEGLIPVVEFQAKSLLLLIDFVTDVLSWYCTPITELSSLAQESFIEKRKSKGFPFFSPSLSDCILLIRRLHAG